MSAHRDLDIIHALFLRDTHSRRMLSVLIHLQLLGQLADTLLELGEEVLLELVDDIRAKLHLVLERRGVVLHLLGKELVPLGQPG